MQPPLNERAAVPLTVLTGFLGAGKTTLLNEILNGDHGLRVAVLVNDFGSVNIDAELVVGVQDDVVSLANGCVCCSIRDDLTATVLDVISRADAPEYILLEASGVAEPGGITMTFTDADLRDRVRLDSVTCVVDADQMFAHEDYPAIQLLKLKQIGYADMVILNKVGLAGPENVERVRQWIDDQFNRVRIVETDYCRVPLEVLISVGRFDRAQLGPDYDSIVEHREQDQASGPTDDHHATFQTWSYETSDPMDLESFSQMIRRRLPASVYRCKGFIHSSEHPGQRVVVQCVGRRVDITLDGDWGDHPAATRLVAIGDPQTMETGELHQLFSGCRV